MTISNTISTILPVYRNEESLTPLVERLLSVYSTMGIKGEIVFVNDGSPDNSWNIIKSLSAKYPQVKGLNLSRNFGQHYAISAGIANSTSDWAVVMDADLQDLPEEIPKLYNKAKEGYDIVLGQRSSRKDSWLKKQLSKQFYRTLSYLSGVKYDGAIANFGIYKRDVIDVIAGLPEKNRFFPSMVKWVGFNSTAVKIKHSHRESGTSSYNLKKRFDLALDIILSYSDKPLRLAIKIGAIFMLFSLIFAIVIAIKWLNNEIEVLGYTSLILSLWFLSGIIILILGVTGLYIGKIFENVKNRPTFIIKEKV